MTGSQPQPFPGRFPAHFKRIFTRSTPNGVCVIYMCVPFRHLRTRSDTMLGSDRTRARVFATFSAYFTCNPGLGHVYVYIYIYVYVYVLSPPFSYIYVCAHAILLRSHGSHGSHEWDHEWDRARYMSGIAHESDRCDHVLWYLVLVQPNPVLRHIIRC